MEKKVERGGRGVESSWYNSFCFKGVLCSERRKSNLKRNERRPLVKNSRKKGKKRRERIVALT